ncbi:MAG: protein kinase, partial [Gemmatimonadota bacterium]
HERRIVHRDVKPENIFIEAASGRPLLSDFGIARPLDADTQLTMAGGSFGTPSYMAPEQVKGAALDERADVYSLGLVGWEMLTGARPWEGETLYDVLHKQQHEPLPSLAALRPDIPSYLLVAIEGALAKAPEDRWADGAALLERLSPVPATLPTRRVPGAKPWNESVVDLRGADRQRAQERSRAAGEPDDEPTMRIDAHSGASVAPGDAQTDAPGDAPLHAGREPDFASRPQALPESDRRDRGLEIRVERLAAASDDTRAHAATPAVAPPAVAPPAVAPPPVTARRRRTMPRLAGPLLVAALASAGAMVVLTGTDLRRSVDAITSAFPWARPDSPQRETPTADAPIANAPATEAPRARADASTRDEVAVRDSSNARIAERARGTPSTAGRTPPATNSPAGVPARSSTPPVAPPVARPPVARPPVARPPAPKAPSPSPAPKAASRTAPGTDARCSSTAYSSQRSCLLAAIDRNDGDLNRIYQENIARLRRQAGGVKEPSSVERLRVEQRAWIAQRDRACRKLRGPLWGAIRIPCYARMSDEREAVLKRRLQGSARD